jgi:Zn-dependent M28 family amino/carboxypeptidase
LAAGDRAAAQNMFSERELRTRVEFLSDSLCTGRGSGTPGGSEAAFWISRQFSQLNLTPFGHFTHCFAMPGKAGHNIIGSIPGRLRGKYVIIMAHYDGLGTLDGKLYPGADSNASGVAALLSLAQAFFQSYKASGQCAPTLIFAALDGRQANMAGAYALCGELLDSKLKDPRTGFVIDREDILEVVNLDIIGSTLAPLDAKRPDFLIMLGGQPHQNDLLSFLNRSQGIGLDLGFDYYGSRDFTELFYRRICDQRPFLEKGIPSVLFTSGITLRTNRTDDVASSLDYSVLRKRIELIYHWISMLR